MEALVYLRRSHHHPQGDKEAIIIKKGLATIDQVLACQLYDKETTFDQGFPETTSLPNNRKKNVWQWVYRINAPSLFAQPTQNGTAVATKRQWCWWVLTPMNFTNHPNFNIKHHKTSLNPDRWWNNFSLLFRNGSLNMHRVAALLSFQFAQHQLPVLDVEGADMAETLAAQIAKMAPMGRP